jgi:hypothetical protein
MLLCLSCTSGKHHDSQGKTDDGPDGGHAERDASLSDARVATRSDAQAGRDAAVAGACDLGKGLAWIDLKVFVREHDQPPALLSSLDRTFTGVVQSHGHGFPARDIRPNDFVLAVDSAPYSYLRIAGHGSDDAEFEVALVATNVPDWGVREGTSVTVHVQQHGTADASLVIRTDDGLALLHGDETDVDRLPAEPEFAFSRGPKLCENDSPCGTIGYFALRARAADGTELLVQPGETIEHAGLRISHSNTLMLLEDRNQCADFSGGRSTVLVTRLSPLPAPAFSCARDDDSTLPGVRIQFGKDAPCEFTLAQAAKGIEIPYTVRVDHDVPDFASEALDIGGCMIPAAGQLGTFERLSGNGQRYALNDVGGCFGAPLRPGTLRKGSYPHVFQWKGRNWGGPSDTGEPQGPPIPPGIYELNVESRGFTEFDEEIDGGAGTPYTMTATLRILLRE